MNFELNERDFDRLVRFVRERYGINLEGKRPLAEARLSFDIRRRGFTSFAQYIDRVLEQPDGEVCQHMLNRLTTNHSYFFREAECIPHLTETVLPEFLREGRREMRVWSAACAGGQEGYSIAMSLESAISLRGYPLSYHIMGSDINTDVLAQAECGVYKGREMEHIPAPYRRFLRPAEGDGFSIADALKRRTGWKRQNLLEKDRDPSRYDVVFCRNVLIYFAAPTRAKMAGILYHSLRPGGYLYIGATETIDPEHRYFRYVAPSIFRREVT